MEKLKINWEPWTSGGSNSFVGRVESQEGYKFQALVIQGLGRFGTWQLTYELQEPTRVVPTIQGAQEKYVKLSNRSGNEQLYLAATALYKYLLGATDGTAELF